MPAFGPCIASTSFVLADSELAGLRLGCAKLQYACSKCALAVIRFGGAGGSTPVPQLLLHLY
jgi:hypothetical protein